jgi:Na+-transporting methylmalonyl-CoA/oxaloacetate decarboxylase gamma subunit
MSRMTIVAVLAVLAVLLAVMSNIVNQPKPPLHGGEETAASTAKTQTDQDSKRVQANMKKMIATKETDGKRGAPAKPPGPKMPDSMKPKPQVMNISGKWFVPEDKDKGGQTKDAASQKPAPKPDAPGH